MNPLMVAKVGAFDPLWLDLSDSVEHEQDILIFVEGYNASLVAGI